MRLNGLVPSHHLVLHQSTWLARQQAMKSKVAFGVGKEMAPDAIRVRSRVAALLQNDVLAILYPPVFATLCRFAFKVAGRRKQACLCQG